MGGLTADCAVEFRFSRSHQKITLVRLRRNRIHGSRAIVLAARAGSERQVSDWQLGPPFPFLLAAVFMPLGRSAWAEIVDAADEVRKVPWFDRQPVPFLLPL